MTPAGTSNELDVQNEWEENTHTHTPPDCAVMCNLINTHTHTHTGPDCAVMCNLINTHTHTHLFYYSILHPFWYCICFRFSSFFFAVSCYFVFIMLSFELCACSSVIFFPVQQTTYRSVSQTRTVPYILVGVMAEARSVNVKNALALGE